MRSPILPTSRTIIRTSRWGTTTAACSSPRTRSRGCRRTTSSARPRSTPFRSVEGRGRGLARDLGQLAGQAERAGDEEALDLIAPVHQRETALRDARQRPDAVGQIAIEAVDGQSDGLDLAFAPALIAAQHALGAGVFADAAGGRYHLAERSGIQQAQIDTLSS